MTDRLVIKIVVQLCEIHARATAILCRVLAQTGPSALASSPASPSFPHQTLRTVSTPSSQAASADAPQPPPGTGVDHYENFPVASFLCPPHLRPAVQVIYHFARTADDIADEGHARPEQRLSELAGYRRALEACVNGETPDAGHWHAIFDPLRLVMQQHDLPAAPFHDLLSAFEQDVRYTASGHRYADQDELMAYCTLSANPVGRLLLHLYGIHDDTSLRQSDHICSALQLINFWQDIQKDHLHQRHYVPVDMLRRHGLQLGDFAPGTQPNTATQVRMGKAIADLCAYAEQLMWQGSPLVKHIPGRAGWELRLVVQGGLRILEKMKARRYRSWETRPKLRVFDGPLLLWRALWM
jgi:hydroxysqualene synthase